MKMNSYLKIVLINIAFLILAISFYFFVNQRIEITTAIIATGISISLGVSKLQIENDKIFKELFKEFNTKYDEKFNDMLNVIVKESSENENYKLNEKERELVIDYLNFSAEEYLWFTKNRIEKKVWNSWENGIIYYLNIKPINEVILKEKELKNSYYGLFDKVGKNIKNWH